jgi:steroid delta-isomerase-like uncharacterized protein
MFIRKDTACLWLVALLFLCSSAVADTEANKALIRDRWLPMIQTADQAIADEIFASGFTCHAPHYPQASDLAGYRVEVINAGAVLADWQVVLEDLLAEDDTVVGRFTAGGKVPPAGIPYTNTWIIFFHFVDGKIAEEWWEYDVLGVQQQLGAIPPSPEGPPAMQRANPEDFTWGTPSGVSGDPGEPEANKALFRRELDAWNQGDVDALLAVLDEIYAPDFVYHDPARPHVTDLASYRQFAAEECFGAFPGFRMPVEDIIAEADRVAARWTFAGTHIALGRPVVQTGITIARIADGKIVEAWCACDMLGTIIQLTAVTPADPGSEGLVAYYPLDAGASDASGNGLDGVVMGDTRLTDGIIGGAMEFDGDGDYIEVAHNALLDITGPISLSLWIRPDAEDPEGQGTETAPMAKAFSTANPSWSWQVRYGWGSAKPYMAFTFNTSPRAWAYVNQNLAQGEWHHIACSADGETLTAYLNGQATESTPMGAITSSPTPVLIGSDGWSCDWIGAIDEVRIYNRALSAGEILFLTGYMADVTAPGDLVQGVPNDGDWPAAETPALAIDDNVNTKYLHFKGDFVPDAGPTGMRVKPSVGPTVVTGVTFTTANDVPGRDPIAFELYGSNGSIDGPYTLIASRDIVDFAGATEWPRFTKNATPIVLNNAAAYSYYQVLFTAIRGPVGGSVNSMQIAEVELFGKPIIPTPDVEANKAVEHRVFEEIWNQGALNVADEVFAPDAVLHGLSASDLAGPAAFKYLVATYRAAIPDIHWTVDDQIGEADMVVTRLTGTGTQQGELMGIPATGQKVTVTAIAMARIAQGRVQETWNSWDALGLMQQLGAASPPRPTPEDYAWLPPSPLTGDPGDPEVNKTMITRFVELEALPDLHCTVHEIVAEGDKAMAYWTVTGTHGGDLAGIPPTGRSVRFSGHTMYRFADGQIVQSWWAWDVMGLMQTPRQKNETL